MANFAQIAMAHLRLIDTLVRAAEAEADLSKQALQDARRRLSAMKDLEQEAREIFAKTMGRNPDV